MYNHKLNEIETAHIEMVVSHIREIVDRAAELKAEAGRTWAGTMKIIASSAGVEIPAGATLIRSEEGLSLTWGDVEQPKEAT